MSTVRSGPSFLRRAGSRRQWAGPYNICGRPLLGKGKRQDCRGAWSDAAICPASGATASCRGPVWDSRTGSKSTPRARGTLLQPGYPDPVSPTVVPYLPSARPYALAALARLRGRSRSFINATLDQQGPDDAGCLVGQGHGDQHLGLARQHPRQPRTRGRAALTGPTDHGAGAQDE